MGPKNILKLFDWVQLFEESVPVSLIFIDKKITKNNKMNSLKSKYEDEESYGQFMFNTCTSPPFLEPIILFPIIQTPDSFIGTG